MGYTFRIGNATPRFDRGSFPTLEAGWSVAPMVLEEAPEFPNDDMTGKSNSRHPSYTGWADFCRATGLYSMFFDPITNNLKAGHPGCIGITTEDFERVKAAREKWQAKSTLPPGFEEDVWSHGPANYDYHLARLLWLEWWMRWALENCETPAIENW